MDKLKKYSQLVKETLEEHIGFPSRDYPNLQDMLVVDATQQHFIFLSIGWHKNEYVHDTVYHLEVKSNGKIWIHQLNTDVEIDVELIAKGVDKADIIGGMVAPYTLAEANGAIEKMEYMGVEAK